MTKNRFEQVDETQPDAINLTLMLRGDVHVGIVHCPKTAAADRLETDLTSEEVPALQALSAAVQLANARKIPIVVIDPDRLWNKEWGHLWRYEEDD
jgi:hypothetical protein